MDAPAEKMAEILGESKPKIPLPIGLIRYLLKLFSSALKNKVHIPTFEFFYEELKFHLTKLD